MQNRRTALKYLATGAAAGASTLTAQSDAKPAASDPALAKPRGTSTDPDLNSPVVAPWPLVLTAPELAMITVLADVILPADELSPAASKVGVPTFLNQWLSAPYDLQRADLDIIRPGLSWLNTYSFKSHAQSFTGLTDGQRTGLLDTIANPATAKEEHVVGAVFLQKFIDLCLTGFYTSSAGFADLGYKGNVPMPTFPGPPPEVLKHLGLA
jgi:hypothetical protein